MNNDEKKDIQNVTQENETLVSGDTGYKPPTVIVNTIGHIVIYEVTDTELTILEEGDNGGIYLNVSISLFSISITLIIALTTCNFNSAALKGGFVAFFIICLLVGGIFLWLYLRSNKRTKEMYKKIRNRN